jgi:HK97 family phage prohead protease
MNKIKQDPGAKPLFGDTFKVKLFDSRELNQLKTGATTLLSKSDYYDDNDEDNKEDKGYLAGYFSTFNNKDRVGDIIRAGAFTKTLKERKPKVLYYHDPTRPIGVVVDAWEDQKGLFGVIKLNTDTQLGMETYNLYKSGAMDSFSIGFQLEKYEVITDKVTGYKSFDIKEVKLMEVSAVTFPANEMAVVTAVKEHYDELAVINNKQVTNAIATSDSIDDLIEALTLAKQTPVTDDEVANFFFSDLEVKSEENLGELADHLMNLEVVSKSDEPVDVDHSFIELFIETK